MTSARVDILLATYNGSAFLEQQLESLVGQTYPHWHLWVRDDGSTDQTPALLAAFAQRWPQKVTVVSDTLGNLGIRGNFSCLMELSRAPYAMFCDQDDVWLPQKIEESLRVMQELEVRWGSAGPLLVYSNLSVMNRDGKEVAPSFWTYQFIDGHSNRLNQLLVQNVVTGCTMLFNAPLRSLALPLPRQYALHDSWLGLVASCFGHLASIDQPLIRYRQHGANVVGAYAYSWSRLLVKLSRLWEVRRRERGLEGQARIFLEAYHDRLSPSQRQTLQAMAHLSQHNFLVRKYLVLRYGLFKTGLFRNLAWLFRA
jgi:glycosyltransferase involved in cell wall biosynthesis